MHLQGSISIMFGSVLAVCEIEKILCCLFSCPNWNRSVGPGIIRQLRGARTLALTFV
jgi:hypothetical protein